MKIQSTVRNVAYFVKRSAILFMVLTVTLSSAFADQDESTSMKPNIIVEPSGTPLAGLSLDERIKLDLANTPEIAITINNAENESNNSRPRGRIVMGSTLSRSTAAFSDIELIAEPTSIVAGIVTWGALSLLLHQLSQDLQNLITSAGAEMQSTITSGKASVDDVIQEIDTRMKDRLDQLADITDDQQRTLYTHANALVQLGNQIVANARDGAITAAKTTAQEMDITTYDALYYLPLRGKKTRVVYSTPESLKSGMDGKIVKIRGNFFDLAGAPTIEGYSGKVTVRKLNNNEMWVEIPDELFREGGDLLQTAKNVFIHIPLGECKRTMLHKEKCGVVSGDGHTVPVTLLPLMLASVTAEISGTAVAGQTRTLEIPYFKHDDNCDADYKDYQQFRFPDPGTTITSATVMEGGVPKKCGDSFDKPFQWAANSVTVFGRVKGCGYNANIIIVKNCKGSAYLHYVVTLQGKFFANAKIEKWSGSESKSNGTNGIFTFQYPMNKLPQDIKSINWRYNVVVTVAQGNNKKLQYSMNDLERGFNGVTTEMKTTKADDGRLVVTIPSSILNGVIP